MFRIVGDGPQTLYWDEYGLNVHFPQGTISPSDTCEIVLKALVGGEFKFPEGAELVSAVYVFSFSKKLLQPVKLEIQHCVSLESKEQFKYISFVEAPSSLTVPPYEFQQIEGGEFSIENCYGWITCTPHCLVGIVLYLFNLPVSLPAISTTESKFLLLYTFIIRHSHFIITIMVIIHSFPPILLDY